MNKKNFKNVLIVFVLLSGSINAQAQLNLGNIVSSITGNSSSSSSTTGDIVSSIVSLITGNKSLTEDDIVGTWTYTEPAVAFESENLLTNTAANLAANKVEDKLASYLEKVGIVAGAFSINFESNKTFNTTIKGKSISGEWELSDGDLVLTCGSIKKLSVTTQIENKKMLIVTDATKLLDLMKVLGSTSSNSSISALTSLMEGIDGMKIGLSLEKK